ncbi:ABC transporter permease [Robertmurraya sp. DFI.2.37]|jgi:ABC-2 type transport system permease protein|uniref:ABC transporter permease n=1 Tax=Robertmurraya sp. DFI.2.37 TaxID=3031819 RepID=UPI0012441D29|nr:ABC transporter permease [Robertmurraya sp. DFI.2.37]MDF1510645.1 ABC transporter permease [Robertmurraya sp. DFI.2.37]
MYKLVQNELLKIFKRSGTYVMIGLLILIVTVVGAFVKYQESGGTVPDNSEWKQGLQLENTNLQRQVEELEGQVPESQITYFKRQIAINEYRIEHGLSPNSAYSVWEFVSDNVSIIELAGMFTIIIAAGIVASEFNWGTIKLLLIRPVSRSRILVAKYLTVLIFALSVVALCFSYSTLLGFILFGGPEHASPYLNYHQGTVTEQSMFMHLLNSYGLNSVNMLMLATMAFMISAVFRSSSLAIGISLFLMFTGAQLTSLVAMKYDWAKYILFANTDLTQYFDGYPLVEGMTLPFSIIVLVVYFILFQLLAHLVFKKRDVAA